MSVSTTLETTINTAADSIHRSLEADRPCDLTNRIEAWCERHGLDRLDSPLPVVARQAAFNILLKATLYEHYHQRDVLPPLPSELSAVREAFRQARQATDDAAFDEYILDEIGWRIDHTDLEDLLHARHQLISVETPAEEIGSLFESLTPQESRRKLGQFRTPIDIADLMAEWLITDGSETVLDPGMGACALSAAVYQKKQQKQQRPTLSDIHGVDLSELALVMGATAVTLSDNGHPHNLRTGDFLDIAPTDMGESVDTVVSNPPYSRHHELSTAYKSRVNSQAEREAGHTVSALSPMYAYFYYHAAEFLKPDGRMSFITPSEFLETSYGESLKQFLLDEFEIHALVLFNRDEASKFDGAMTTSLVSFLQKSTETSEERLTRFVRVDGNPSDREVLAAVSGDIEGGTEWGFVNTVRQTDIDAAEKWTGFFDPVDIDTSGLTPLSEFATVNRGIATGQNSYFCLTPTEVDEWGLDEQYLSKIIRNSRSVPGYDYTEEDWQAERDAGREVWLLYHLTDLDPTILKQVPSDDATEPTLTAYSDGESEVRKDAISNVVEYLRYGLSDEIEAHSGYLARNRNPWFVVDRRDPPPIVLTYMSRGGTRFIRNKTEARYLSNLHGLYLDVELDEARLKALLAYLNSDFANEIVRRSGRTYSSGMDKIEPNEMEGVPVVDPRDLGSETVQTLAELFDRLTVTARDGSGSVDDVVADIDAVLKNVLNR